MDDGFCRGRGVDRGSLPVFVGSPRVVQALGYQELK
jgi:hypothetical protein